MLSWNRLPLLRQRAVQPAAVQPQCGLQQCSPWEPTHHSNNNQKNRPPHLQAGLRDLLGQQVRFVHCHNQAEAQRQWPLAAVVAAACGGTNILRQDGAQRRARQRAVKVCIGSRLKWQAWNTVGSLTAGQGCRKLWLGAMPTTDLVLEPAQTPSTSAPSATHLQRPPRTARRTAGTFAAQSCGQPAGTETWRRRERHMACIHSHASLAYIPMTSACH